MLSLSNKTFMILMKAAFQSSRKKSPARHVTGKVHLSATASGLTSQAGLIPVVKFLGGIGFEDLVEQTVPHTRGDNATYQLADVMLLTLVSPFRRRQVGTRARPFRALQQGCAHG